MTKAEFAPFMTYLQYRDYAELYKSITEESKIDFLKRFASEFKRIEEDGRLNPDLFQEDELRQLREIMENPQEYYYRSSKASDYEFLRCLPPQRYPEVLKRWFKEQTGKELDLENPKTFREKIQWLKLYDSTAFKTRLADKVLVREWIKETIGGKRLVPLLGVYSKFEDIDFSRLPERFVMKTTHGSGWNIVVSDKELFDRDDAKRKFDLWMKKSAAICGGLELHYADIKPRILVEEYLDLSAGVELLFWCFNGKIEFVSIHKEPHGANRKMTVDLNWKQLPFVVSWPELSDEEKAGITKPQDFDDAAADVRVLCEGLPFVRVDCYACNGKTWFGEMTFTPASGKKPQFEGLDREFGELLVLPDTKQPLPASSLAQRGIPPLPTARRIDPRHLMDLGR
ncbi:MAG: hypothetical protein IJ722_07730 [Alloprevotella sp.]|nr:hypothetical protein [Alloprevotella sp.]